MTDSKARGTLVLAAIGGALIGLLVVVPAILSLTANGEGAVCLTDFACPLSVINPCVRRPAFAVVGRCAIH